MKRFFALTFLLLLLAGCGATNTPTDDPQATLEQPGVMDVVPSPPSNPTVISPPPPVFPQTPSGDVQRNCCNLGICESNGIFNLVRANFANGVTREDSISSFVRSCITEACSSCGIQIINVVYPEDMCPFDPHKLEPGICGCGFTDDDFDEDGLPWCIDNCPTIFNPNQLDSDFDGRGDVCDVPPIAIIPNGSAIFADDGVFLGSIGSSFDANSVANRFGTYGSRFQSNSIWNHFGTYGGEFNQLSPWNEFTRTPPLILDSNDFFVAYLTTNPFLTPAIHPNDLAILIGRTDVLR